MLEDAIQSYMAEVRRFRAPKTIAAAQHMLALIWGAVRWEVHPEHHREDLLDHMAALQERGLGQRGRSNTTSRGSARCCGRTRS